MCQATTNKRSGYSRTDMVVMMVVGGAVISLLVIALAKVRRHQDRIPYPDGNSLKQHVLACHSSNDVYKRLPAAFDNFKGAFAATVHVHLLPFLEYDALYQTYLQAGKVTKNDIGIRVFHAFLDTSRRHNDTDIQNFAANLRVFSDKGRHTHFEADMPALARIEPGTASIPGTFEDGTSNTILFATKYAHCGEGGSLFAAAPNSPFAAFFGQSAARDKAHPSAQAVTFQLAPSPENCRTSPLTAQSFEGFTDRGLLVAFADGSVRFVSPNISPRTWNMLLQPNDGMQLGRDWDD